MADQKQTVKETVRKFVVPTVVGVAGGVAGLALNRKRGIRESMPDIKKIGVGDLADDLREKLETVLGKGDDGSETDSQPSRERERVSPVGRMVDRAELEARRRERSQRRASRRQG